MPCNLGASSLPQKRRAKDPMRTFDRLPQPVRVWLSQAALPWSPQSAQRIWARAQAKGLSIEATLNQLSAAEAKTLSRDQFATQNQINS